MSKVTGQAFDMCWSYDSIGRWLPGGWQSFQGGSYRQGSGKTLPQCGAVDINVLEAAWTRTAVIPHETGPVSTYGPLSTIQNTVWEPTTVERTVTREHTSTLTPTSK